MAQDHDIQQEETPPVFVIGLSMAGAISAGAYTAGVVDYLFRAMRAHNARLGQEDATHPAPGHRVVVKAISGASAGGTTAGLIVASLLDAGGDDGPAWDSPVTGSFPARDGKGLGSFDYVLGPVHKVWVDSLSMFDETTGTGLLADSDLVNGATPLDWTPLDGLKLPLRALLDGNAIDAAAQDVLSDIKAWSDSAPGYDFISGTFDLFLMTTSLQGLAMQVQFAAGQSFSMTQHSLVRHFTLTGMGSGPDLPSPWLEDWRDDGIALDPRNCGPGPMIPFTEVDCARSWKKLTVACIATGAFPFALPARYMDATNAELGAEDAQGRRQGGAMPLNLQGGEEAPRIFPEGTSPALAAPYVAIDGGTINNEPFEYARYAIRQRPAGESRGLAANPRDAKTADRAVILVDPFPGVVINQPLTREDASRSAGLPDVLRRLKGLLVAQARFKPEELLLASKEDVKSRFIISPVRKGGAKGDRSILGAEAIASGCLGGFGGFLRRDFRQHDFILGQRNCQRFLQEHFTLDPANKVLAGKSPSGRIIDPGPDMPEILDPAWPDLSAQELQPVIHRAMTRIDRVIASLKADGALSGVLPRAASTLFSLFGKKRTRLRLTGIILADLLLRDQLKEPGLSAALTQALKAGPPGADTAPDSADMAMARQVLAAVMRAGNSGLTAAEVHAALKAARVTPLPQVHDIAAMLAELKAQDLCETPGWNRLAGAARSFRYAFPKAP
ncbi:hypothetical protein [Pseudooceanicola sp. HF7]|uniref:hypothetical protein n=1 Tax=Pseudooceanicola sp. HF7 TaxID=2721560 RepID=UPI00143221FA|nr:hypothetical protein [Pseudooceanicola sp. HF7]NIZ09681.1 hypothetical protein [Pseudooceanicola sp. HF7]